MEAESFLAAASSRHAREGSPRRTSRHQLCQTADWPRSQPPPDVNGCRVGNQATCGSVRKLFLASLLPRRAATENRHARQGLVGGWAALSCVVLFLSAQGHTGAANQRGNAPARTIEFTHAELAVLVDVNATKPHGEHATELTDGGRVRSCSCLHVPCQNSYSLNLVCHPSGARLQRRLECITLRC